jgi:hypothetical protein
MRLPFLCSFLLTGMFCAGSAAATVVEGRVVDRVTQQPLAGATVTLAVPGFLSTPRIIVATTQSGADGSYSVETDRTGFFLMARAAGHAARDHVDQPCIEPLHCNPAAMALTADSPLHTVDFALDPAARISGRLGDALTLSPPAVGAQTRVSMQHIGTPSLNYLRISVPVDASGQFVVDNLPGGSYSLDATGVIADGAEAGTNYLRSVWPDRHCDDLQVACDSVRDTPLILAAGEIRDGVDLTLQRGSRVRVRLLSSGNGGTVPQRAIAVTADGSIGMSYGSYSDGSGYSIVGPLLPGPVKLLLQPKLPLAYPNVVYPDRPCIGDTCDLAGAPTIAVPADSLITVADAQVAPLRTVAGRVTDANGAPLGGVRVSIGLTRNPTADILWGFYPEATTLTASDGSYRLEGYDGTHRIVRTEQAGAGYVDEAWQDTPCDAMNLFCNPLDTALPALDLQAAPHLTSIDFALDAGADASIRGRVVDAATSAPLPGYRVSVVPAANPYLARPLVSDVKGHFAIVGLTPGDYFLFATASGAVSHVPGWLYPNRPCTVRFVGWPTQCDLTGATPFTVGAGTLIDNITFAVSSGPIFTDGFDP